MPTSPSLRNCMLLFTVAVGAVAPHANAQRPNERFENLQVLPDDISRNELNRAMLENLFGLGLRRLAGEGCLFCHVGNMEEPRETWDYAADDKLTKRKARTMMAMVRDINESHLPNLEERIDSTMRVTCYTCHAGRTDPRPLSTVLLAAYDAGGVDSAVTTYWALRTAYLNSDAYDFRVRTLATVATILADRGAFDDAVTLTALNVEVYPEDADAKRIWIRAQLERTVNEAGVQTALEQLDNMEAELEPGVATPTLLDGLGWRLYRQEKKSEAMAIFERNRHKFPDEYLPNESIVFTLVDNGDEAAGLRILEEWLAAHPDHDRARNLLINLRRR